MPKQDPSDSEPEESSGNSSPEKELQFPAGGQNQGVSEYEKQRLSRIAENKARLEALGLPKMASSLMGRHHNVRCKKGKAKVEADEEYRPDEGKARLSSSSGEEKDVYDEDEDEEFLSNKSPGSRQKKVNSKNKDRRSRGNVSSSWDNHMSDLEHMDDNDALRQAIDLSLQGIVGVPCCFESNEANASTAKRKVNILNQEDKGRRKSKQSFSSRLQITEDELIMFFFQIDESGKGGISIRDLEKAAIAQDFAWTDKELADMISCFDSDGDGKLSLDDFRKIAVRCNMLKESQTF